MLKNQPLKENNQVDFVKKHDLQPELEIWMEKYDKIKGELLEKIKEIELEKGISMDKNAILKENEKLRAKCYLLEGEIEQLKLNETQDSRVNEYNLKHEWENKIEELEKEKDELRNYLEAANKHIDKLSRKKSSLNNVNLEIKVKELDNLNDNIKAELIFWKGESGKWEEKYLELQKKKNETINRMNEIERNEFQRRTSRNDLFNREELIGLQKELNDYKKKFFEIENKFIHRDSFEKLDQVKANLGEKIIFLCLEVERLKSDNNYLHLKLGNLNKEGETEHLNKELKLLKIQSEYIEQELICKNQKVIMLCIEIERLNKNNGNFFCFLIYSKIYNLILIYFFKINLKKSNF